MLVCLVFILEPALIWKVPQAKLNAKKLHNAVTVDQLFITAAMFSSNRALPMHNAVVLCRKFLIAAIKACPNCSENGSMFVMAIK